MTSVLVGVWVPEALGGVRETLHSLAGTRADVVLLPDGLDVAREPQVPQLDTAGAIGAPACFNRLARAGNADVIVFLESGVVAGPAWLERLLEALAAHPSHGLAGPSTNNAWNEQRAFPRARGTPEDVAARAAEARARFGATWRTLEPLYSLADFCYAVRREVIDAIGDADEGYGRGPCWEMDYNVRAARAGYRGVWARSAYVYRPARSRRRRDDETRLFERNKHRYQDKFCGLRLRGERTTYEPHCHGEACEHFAPAAAIAPARDDPSSATPRVALVAESPLVSCIMPTRDRPEFARQAVAYFRRQTLERTELLVVDDGPADWVSSLPADARIRHVPVAAGTSIGAKRNRGVELARGGLIAHWDDDDWYAPTRLERQIAPLMGGDAEICGLKTGAIFDLPEWRFWRVTPALHGRLFVQDVHGGTLVYQRRLWEQGVRYPALSIAEDAHFLARAVRQGARLARLPGDDLFIYLRHRANAWRFACGVHVDPRGWEQVAEPPQLAADRPFYLARAGRSASDDGPLVSCVMPTADRRRFVAQAIAYFLRQHYGRTELLVVDDGDDPVADLMPLDARVRYERLPSRLVLGSKRNLACEMARGDVIVHWDDDDWMARDRLRRQVHALSAGMVPGVCGLAELLFYAPEARRAWRYRHVSPGRPWVAGNTLCYHKAVWQRRPFPAVREGEDTRFVWALPPAQVQAMVDGTFFVAMVHSRNSSPKRTGDAAWATVDPEVPRTLLGADAAFYDALDLTTAG